MAVLISAFLGSVGNARRAAARLSRSNAERAVLTSSIESDRHEHGAITRLSKREALSLLRSRRVGRFAFVDRGRAPSVVPVNYLVTRDGVVLFRTGPGPKLSSVDNGDLVAFEVDDIDEQLHTGWSVLVTGHGRRLPHREADALSRQPAPWAGGPRTYVVAIEPTHVEGRRLY